ncbi:MAG: ribosome-associated translation inhibitor RaiA [Pseudomonadota bacterium]
MEVLVTFRHVESNDALKEYAQEKVLRIEKYISNITEVHVILAQEKRNYIAEVLVKANRAKITAKESTEDTMYASIDLVMDKIERQVKKYKDKLTSHKDHHRKARHNVYSGEDFEETKTSTIVKTESVSIKTMTVDGALIQMELVNDDFFVFRNSETDTVNVLYRRRDGDFGLIEPENTGD